MKENKKETKSSFLLTLAAALICAGIVRSLFFEPFHIPSSSMKPNLLIGDYIFVAKYSYGYSRYSFPFGFDIFEGRIWESSPKRGDIAVFRLPKNPRINYIKRIIGLPGDEIQVRNGVVYLNNKALKKSYDGEFSENNYIKIQQFIETLPSSREFKILDQNPNNIADNTGIYKVPKNHYFMMGDNRDNSQDSRFLSDVGYIPKENLVGRATIIFFSNEKPIWQIWNWPFSIRFERIFNKIK